jgi:hypothetical protein
MKPRVKWTVGVAVLVGAAGVGTVAVAGGDKPIREDLVGYQEVPAISTDGNGTFKARIDRNGQQISYQLSYADLEGDVQQAHIHIGQRAVNGKIVAFLCSNLPSPPAGTPACPAAPGTVEGTIEPADVLNTTTPPPDTAGQGIEAGAFGELVDAIKAGATYANLHSTKWPGGEIRAQIEHDNRNGD